MSVSAPSSSYSRADPSTWDKLSSSGFIIGVDVGMHADHSAYVLAAVWPFAAHAIGVIDVKQFPLSTPFEEIADEVATVARDNRAKVIVDASNNSAFASMLAARLPQPPVNHLVVVAITGALAHAAQPTPMAVAIGGLRTAVMRWTLSKSELLETVAAEFGGRLIRVAKIGDWEVLQEELDTFNRTARTSGSASYSAPSGKHDDMVLALSLAVFGCRRLGRQAQTRRPIGRRPPGALGWT
jgi:hypothetical protein